MNKPVQFRKVRPGLYERIDTPRQVPISEQLIEAIRIESPALAKLLEAAEESMSN